MPLTTKRFVWKDRDTAARDMLQLAYHAPITISRQALQLLQAFRSLAIMPELKELVLDETRDIWERRYALYALAEIPGDIWFPEMARFAHYVPRDQEVYSVRTELALESCMTLAEAHPANVSWLFQQVEQQPHSMYLQALMSLVPECGGEKGLRIVFQRIAALYDTDPYLIEMEDIRALCSAADESFLEWLDSRHDLITYLCQGNYAPTISEELRRWIGARRDQLNGILDWWSRYQLRTLPRRPFEPDPFSEKFRANPIWQELNGWYEAALAGDKKAFYRLRTIVYHEQDNLARRADATRFLGKLKDQYDVREPLFHAVRYGPVDPKWSYRSWVSPIRFEAGAALREMPSADVWETMIDAYFIDPDQNLMSFFMAWIAHLTDQLSGIHTPYKGSGRSHSERSYLD
ncbi:MAG TPA: hypothetical protein PLQ56_06100 [Aggregatilineales bacterium]|nr:hypothetical protein [Aggregatilineales bacterium]